MGHLHREKEEVYRALVGTLDRNPPGAPYTETLLSILKHLYTEEEARLGSEFPGFINSWDDLKEKTSLGEKELSYHLDNMVAKGLVTDLKTRGNTYYMLTPMVVGFFEYTFMRAPSDLPMEELAQLFEEYFKENGVAEGIFGGNTRMFQAWAYEKFIPPEVETEVMDYEKASAMIREAGGGALTDCSCRHKAWHLGKNCDAPVDVCTSLGKAAEWLIEKGFARRAGVDELLRVLDRTEEYGLVHLADNVQKEPAYLCHCCGCCCGPLRAIKEQGVMSVHTSNFIPAFNLENCSGCGSCAEKCHLGAIKIVEETPGDKNSRYPVLNEDICIGCGICIDACKKDAVYLLRRQTLHIPPAGKKDQMIRMAMDRGKK